MSACPLASYVSCNYIGMQRNPLWTGEVDIVRAIFGHAANVDSYRLLSLVEKQRPDRVVQMSLEERIGNRRLDVLVTFGDDDRSASEELVVEAKVGAVVEAGTLAEYLAKVQARTGLASGLLVAPYQPVGLLPSGWAYQDLRDVTGQLGCPVSGRLRHARSVRRSDMRSRRLAPQTG